MGASSEGRGILEGHGRVLALKKPPPLVPSCLMASMKPTGPRSEGLGDPVQRVVDLVVPARVCTAPGPRDEAAMKAMGARM